ncbi:MAG: type 2 isopentenyl-diphosphate Delta-isomerase [Acidobacteriota bacterium]
MPPTAATASPELESPERDRKLEHIELALDRRTQLESRFFDAYEFEHQALPELALDAIDLSVDFLGRRLRAPLLISCMTGGTDNAARINRHLAQAAERTGVALGVGSQRKALESPETASTFHVRALAPSVPVIANLGAVQLNYGFGIEECRAAVRMVGADALALHLNPLQEALQPEGQCDFRGLYDKIEAVVAELEVPVIVKEIGCGLAGSTARELARRGVRILDTAGLGGTSWARIEAARAGTVALGELFAGWGVPTPDSIRAAAAVDSVTVIGSGGVRDGVEVAKAIACGAHLVGLAQRFLEPAMESAEAVVETIEAIVHELRIAMFCAGAADLEALRRTPLIEGRGRGGR